MGFWSNRSGLDGPPPPDRREWTVNVNADPRPVTHAETDEWFASAQERDFIIVFRQIEALLDVLAKEGWGLRCRMIRKQLRWLRGHASRRGLAWGEYDHHGLARIR